MKHRLRVTYSVDGPLRYASNLDQMRVWTRAARRAGLPLLYSEGFNPRPRIQVAAALPVGFAAGAELLDLWLTESVDPAVVQEALTQTLPDGLGILMVEEIDPTDPALPTLVLAAKYYVAVEMDQQSEALRQCIRDTLAADNLPRERRGRSYDLRPLIEQLWVVDEQPGEIGLGMVLAAREGATGRPEEVLDVLDLAQDRFHIRRLRLLLAEKAQG